MKVIYLCDDCPEVLSSYQILLESIAEKYSIPLAIKTFTSGEQLLFYFEDAPDEAAVIYLDIMMKGTDGMETARKLRLGGCTSELIFLTANPEFVFESFDVSPTNYIVKNTVTPKKFEDVFLKALANADKKSKEIFRCENGSVIKAIPVSSISHFEVVNRMTTVHYDQTSFSFYSSLETVEEKVKASAFLRIHRSYLVHFPYISQVDRTSLLLVNGTTLPIGVTYAKRVKENISYYFKLYESF